MEKDLDAEWVALLLEAKELGISSEEIKDYLKVENEKVKKGNILFKRDFFRSN